VASTVVVSNVSKHFGRRKALDAVSFAVEPGEFVALIGSSGAGKSTLLRHIAGLVAADPAGASSIEVGGCCVQRIGRIAPNVRDVRAGIGFVFQHFNLVGRLPVLTNVLTGLLHRMPVWRSVTRQFNRDEIHAGLEALARVGMADRALERSSTLSGGQQQRVAVARTLVQRARTILADEPIASLDPTSARRIMGLLAKINNDDGVTVLVSIHQVDIALRYCPRAIALSHGKIVYDGPSELLTLERLQRLYGTEADELLQRSDTPTGNPELFPSSANPSGADGAIRAEFAALSRVN
jgi:phosphonate transport system ATP-binding protein